jgi:hypothetical protein
MWMLAGSFGCLMISLTLAAPASAQVLNLTKDVESGVGAFIAWERAWTRECKTIPVTVTITKRPINGTASVETNVASTIPASTPTSGDTSACAGKPVTGNRVNYKSNAGFRGKDTFSFTASNQPQRPREVVITVK